MSHYITRWCPEHGDWDDDVDNPSEACEACIKEGKFQTREQLLQRATEAESRAARAGEALQKLLDALEEEAKATASAVVAHDNFSNPSPEFRRKERALIAVVDAMTDARRAINEKMA